MRDVIAYAAHLRVYEPLGAFPEEERRRWSAYVESGTAPSRPMLMALEQQAAITAALAVPPRAEMRVDDHAYVRHLDGLTYVCPWRLQQRAWESLEDFRATLPEELAEAFFPPAVLSGAEADHDDWTAANPDVKVGVLSSTWTVPLPWFALFERDERRLELGERRAAGAPPHTGLDRALVYLTAMSRARRRAARALHVVQRGLGEGPAVDALDDVARWLEEFHPHSLVELDYGGIVHLLDDEELSADASVADVALSLEQLAKGDISAAGEVYEAVVARWRAVAALERAN
jgi:hypothetical protein